MRTATRATTSRLAVTSQPQGNRRREPTWGASSSGRQSNRSGWAAGSAGAGRRCRAALQRFQRRRRRLTGRRRLEHERHRRRRGARRPGPRRGTRPDAEHLEIPVLVPVGDRTAGHTGGVGFLVRHVCALGAVRMRIAGNEDTRPQAGSRASHCPSRLTTATPERTCSRARTGYWRRESGP